MMRLSCLSSYTCFVVLLSLSGPTSAAPILFEKVSSSHSAGLPLGTANYFFQDSFSDGSTSSSNYSIHTGAQNLAADIILTPADWLVELFGDISIVPDISLLNVGFETTLRLIGDPGRRALISGSAHVTGYSNMQAFASPSADLRSHVGAWLGINGTGYIGPSLNRTRNSVGSLFDTSIVSMGTDTKYFSPITLTVGDELTLRGTFSIWTFAEINDYCLPFIGCVPGAGPYAVTQTVGNFGTVLNIEELQPPSSVPEPGVLSLFSLGLLGLGFARRWCAG